MFLARPLQRGQHLDQLVLSTAQQLNNVLMRRVARYFDHQPKGDRIQTRSDSESVWRGTSCPHLVLSTLTTKDLECRCEDATYFHLEEMVLGSSPSSRPTWRL